MLKELFGGQGMTEQEKIAFLNQIKPLEMPELASSAKASTIALVVACLFAGFMVAMGVMIVIDGKLG